MENNESYFNLKNNIIINSNEEVNSNELKMGNYVDLLPKTELREIEQYFFTENVISNIVEALDYEDNIICLGTPAVANGFYQLKNKNVLCLDIDDRFSYLPGYRKFDILNPDVSLIDYPPNVLIIDPPFFKLNLVDLYNCVEVITKGNKKTKILFAFVQREERALLSIFKAYNLQLTKFKLEYKYVEENRWSNYVLYSNCEFNKIKFSKINKSSNNTIKKIK